MTGRADVSGLDVYEYFLPFPFTVVSTVDTRDPSPTTLVAVFGRSILSTMSTAMPQAARATLTLRPRVTQQSRTIRSSGRYARRQVSCAASPTEAIKDKRIPVTILTGFLG